MIGICYLIVALCIFLVIYFGALKLTPATSRDFLSWTDERTKTLDMVNLMSAEITQATGDAPIRMKVNPDWTIAVYLECKNDCKNLLTVETIKKLHSIEMWISEQPQWRNLCLAQSVDDTNCSQNAISSITKFLGDID